MIIFLYGLDTYRSRQKLKEIIGQYKKIHKSGLSLICLDGENLEKAKRTSSSSSLTEASAEVKKKESSLASLSHSESSVFEDFKDAIQQTSMFSEKKLMILSNVFKNQDFKEKFFKNAKEFLKSKDTILLYEESEISGKDKLFKFLKTEAKTQNFQLLEGEKLKNWIKQELSNLKTEISPEALNKLIEFVGNDLWQMSNEIKKLVNYRAPRQRSEGGKENEVLFDHKKDKKIHPEDIELLIKPKIETAIFKTIDAIAQKNRKQALLLIHQHLEKGDSSLYLLSMINFQFRNLLIIKDLIERHRPYYSILKMTRLHPFVVKKSYQQANKFTLSELKKIYQKIFQADLDIKTGKINPQVVLDLLIAEI